MLSVKSNGPQFDAGSTFIFANKKYFLSDYYMLGTVNTIMSRKW